MVKMSHAWVYLLLIFLPLPTHLLISSPSPISVPLSCVDIFTKMQCLHVKDCCSHVTFGDQLCVCTIITTPY